MPSNHLTGVKSPGCSYWIVKTIKPSIVNFPITKSRQHYLRVALPETYQHLVDLEVGKTDLTRYVVTENMHERKKVMFMNADAIVVMPGGAGAMDEVVEVLTWAQLGLHKKPFGLLNVNGYYDHLIQFFDHIVDHKFMHQENRSMILVDDSPTRLIEKMEAYRAPEREKWLDRSKT